MNRDWPSSLEIARYTYVEADRIAGVTRGTAKRWLKGYSFVRSDGQRVHQPPVPDRAREATVGVSFLELVEIAAIGRLKDASLSLREIRMVVDACRQFFPSDRPLVTYRFKTDGRQVFVDEHGSLVEVSARRRRRAWDEVLGPFLMTIEYEGDLPHRWWPRGPEHLIVVDPEFGFGLPVVAGTGVRTETLYEQWVTGSKHRQIARDFKLTVTQVEEALQFESLRAQQVEAAAG